MTVSLPSASAKDDDLGDAVLTTVRGVLRIEAQTIERLGQRLGSEVLQAVQTIRGLGVRGGRLVVMGVGKSGHIAKKLVGIFTDGNLRRVLEKQILHAQTGVKEFMPKGIKTISSESLATEAARLMDERRINHLVIVDGNNHLIGVLGLHDLLDSKIL